MTRPKKHSPHHSEGKATRSGHRHPARVPRVYEPDSTSTASSRGSVRLPFSSRKGPPLKLDQVGKWRYVAYMVSNILGSPVGEADLDSYEGIYTGTIGGCSAVAFLFADVNDTGFSRSNGCYKYATLAHLAGGNPAGVNWKAMTRNHSKDQLAEWGKKPYHIAAVIFTDTRSAAERIVGKVATLGLPQHCMTVYLSQDLSGAGVNKHGFFGLVPGPYPR